VIVKRNKPTGVTGAAALGDTIVDTEFLARRFGMPANTWAKWRCQRKGPPFIKLGARVFYRLSAVERYLDEHTIDPAAVTEAR
jgi:hypothetical protein